MSPGPSFGDLVRAQLDELLVPLGFASGQGDSGQIIFCAPAGPEVLRKHFPRAGFIAEQFPAAGGGCLDFIVEGDLRDGIADVRLEGHALSEVLARAGVLDGAQLAAGWPGDSIPSDLQRIRRLLGALVVRG